MEVDFIHQTAVQKMKEEVHTVEVVGIVITMAGDDHGSDLRETTTEHQLLLFLVLSSIGKEVLRTFVIEEVLFHFHWGLNV